MRGQGPISWVTPTRTTPSRREGIRALGLLENVPGTLPEERTSHSGIGIGGRDFDDHVAQLGSLDDVRDPTVDRE